MKQAVEGMHKCSKTSIACILLDTGRIPNPTVFIKGHQQFVLLLKTEMFQKKNYMFADRERESKKSDGLRSVELV